MYEFHACESLIWRARPANFIVLKVLFWWNKSTSTTGEEEARGCSMLFSRIFDMGLMNFHCVSGVLSLYWFSRNAPCLVHVAAYKTALFSLLRRRVWRRCDLIDCIQRINYSFCQFASFLLGGITQNVMKIFTFFPPLSTPLNTSHTIKWWLFQFITSRGWLYSTHENHAECWMDVKSFKSRQSFSLSHFFVGCCKCIKTSQSQVFNCTNWVSFTFSSPLEIGIRTDANFSQHSSRTGAKTHCRP